MEFTRLQEITGNPIWSCVMEEIVQGEVLPAKDENALEVAGSTQLAGINKVDIDMLDRAVHALNNIYTNKGLEMYQEVAEYILTNFFGNDLEQYNKHGNKHATYNALKTRDDFLLKSSSQFWYAVEIREQCKLLPDGTGEALSVSHHRRLVHVKDNKLKEKLAKKAVSKSFTVKQLEDEIKKNKKKSNDGRGRPSLPAYFKGLKKLVTAIDMATKDKITSDTFIHEKSGVDDENLVKNTRDLLKQVDKRLEKLQELRNTLQPYL